MRWTVLSALLLALACTSRAPRIEVKGAWARPSVARGMEDPAPPDSPGVVYLTVGNRGGLPDRLLSATTEVADVVEIHETRVEGERTRMVHLVDGAAIPARATLVLRPGGMHLMLLGLRRHLRPGESFPLTLRFETAPHQTVQVEVRQ